MTGENYVVKHNKLIEAKGRMTLMEQKILRAVISVIKPEDKDFKEYQIDVREFQELSGSDGRKDLYNELKDVSHRLMDRKIEIEELIAEGKKRFLVTRYISSAEYVTGEGHIKILFDPKLKPYLLDLKEQYTQYQLKYVMQMRSAHALRLYELLKQYEAVGRRRFTLDDFKQYLGVEGYSAFKDLERRVLRPSQDEINEMTDLFVEYSKICQGRGAKVVAIEYSIKSQQIKRRKAAENKDSQFEDIKRKSGLSAENFGKKQIMDLYQIAQDMTKDAEADPCEYIRLNYMSMMTKEGIRSKLHWLKRALKEDWAQAAFQIRIGFDILSYTKGRGDE